MRGLGRVIEFLRPLVKAKAWDYCVVWRLSDEPSNRRLIGWMDCCCSGGYQSNNVKEEKGEPSFSGLCMDTHIQHPRRTNACEALARLSSSLPLCSGIYGEVVISNQPKWFNHVDASDLNPSQDSTGTRVLIPVSGGLIELFVTEQVPNDGNVVELVMSLCNFSLEQEAISLQSYNNFILNEQLLDISAEDNSQNCKTTLPLSNFFPRVQFLSSSYPSIETSSSSSNPSNEDPSFDFSFISENGYLSQPIGNNTSGTKKLNYNENLLNQQRAIGCGGASLVAKDNIKGVKRQGTIEYHSKNLITERNRRNKIKDGLFSLRALVPKISKMDRASILGDAIEYIQELQMEVKQLNNELRELKEEDCKNNKAVLKISLPVGGKGGSRGKPPIEHKSIGEMKHMEVQMEVNQLDKRSFLIKLFSEQKRGAFVRLMEAIDSLGLQVSDANISTFHNWVLNILRVEANKDGIQPKKLRESLMKITS